MHSAHDRAAFCVMVACATALWGGAAQGQQDTQSTATAPHAAELDEIIVTARKRQESILNVPVIETAISAQTLESNQATTISDLPALVPGLNVEHTFLSIGPLVSIRGVGTTSEDPGVQQSVGLNIDGMSLANGLAFSSGLFDLAEAEVLKGPQALFYGKSSPAGVISLRTADPTDRKEVIATAGYEFIAVEPLASLILSGPVSDTVKMRLSAQYYHQDGYFKNEAVAAPGLGGLSAERSHDPYGQDYQIRLTTLWNPTDQFSARVKLNMDYDRMERADTRECADLPGGNTPPPGLPQFVSGADTCRISNVLHGVGLNPNGFPGVDSGGVPFNLQNQHFGTVELNYLPVPDVTISSTTGYYNLIARSLVNATNASFAGPPFGAGNSFKEQNFSEELRANSEYAGPLNYTVGGLFQNDHLADQVRILGNTAERLPPLLGGGRNVIDSRTYSLFGQGRWKIIDRLELAAGLRWTDETRALSVTSLAGSAVPVAVPSINSRNYSPELTLTYRPTDDLTWFAAAKQGYKSGGFSIATPIAPGANNAFHDEKVQGGEVGLKSRWLDHQLAVNIAPYYYRYTGLQVGVISPPANGLPVIQTVNAAVAQVYGIDLDSAYRPAQVEGLELKGAVLWNHARYLDFNNAACWGGQTVATGCNSLFNPLVKNLDGTTGAFTAQDLSGTPLAGAPNWQINVGFDYTMPIANGYQLTFSNNNQYSSRLVRVLAIDRPNNDQYQTAYAKVDVGLSLKSPTDLWEVALLAKNVNDKLISTHCEIGGVKLGGLITNQSGTAGPSPLGVDGENCFVDPGREVWLKFTLKPFN